MVHAPGIEWNRHPQRGPEPSVGDLGGEALERSILERSILERDWEIGLRRNVVWIATQVRFFFTDTNGRSLHAALAESYRKALDWTAGREPEPDRIRSVA